MALIKNNVVMWNYVAFINNITTFYVILPSIDVIKFTAFTVLTDFECLHFIFFILWCLITYLLLLLLLYILKNLTISLISRFIEALSVLHEKKNCLQLMRNMIFCYGFVKDNFKLYALLYFCSNFNPCTIFN